MFSQVSVLALAALSTVQGSPLQVRQASSAVSSAASAASSAVASVISSAPSSAASAASSAVASATGAAGNVTSSVASATSAASSAVSSAASSSVAIPSASSGAQTGNDSYPAYPCPPGYLLTYVTANTTLPVSVREATAAFGNWSSSPVFPNVTDPTGGNTINSTHTINVQGLSIIEELTNVTSNSTSGYLQLTWNMTNGPISAMGISISNYTTVLALYNPVFSTEPTANRTTALAYTNFCANNQTAGAALVSALTQLELGTLQQLIARSASNSTMSMSSAAAGATSSAASATSAAANMTSSMASSAASGASSVASGASSAASTGASAISSAASAAASAVSSGVSSVASAASSSA